MKLTICLDVGGSFIKGTVFDENANELIEGINYYPAKSNTAAKEIIKNLRTIIQDLSSQVLTGEKKIEAIMLAFPGPFDYGKGISLIKGLGKYEALYQKNIKELLLEELLRQSAVQLEQKVTIQFFNDAASFAFGEYAQTKNEVKRGAYFTLGTGCGSTFIEDGESVKGCLGIPDSGMIYKEQFLDSIIDDYISARGFSEVIIREYGKELSPVEISKLARTGDDAAAIKAFEIFGQMIGAALSKYIEAFQPNEIVFGGQISKSFPLMEFSIRKVLDQVASNYQLRVSQNTSYSTIRGLEYLKKYKGDEAVVK